MSTRGTSSYARRDHDDVPAALRLEVVRLRRREGRRRFDTEVHVGELGGERQACPVPEEALVVLDAGTRTEVVTTLLDRRAAEGGVSAAADVWLTRYGVSDLQDEDLAWLSASTRAFDIVGVQLRGFWTVTRTGWFEVRTGERRTWRRPRL